MSKSFQRMARMQPQTGRRYTEPFERLYALDVLIALSNPIASS
jgi:hypothetical protein